VQDAWTGNPDMTARQPDLGWYEGPHPDYLVQEYLVGMCLAVLWAGPLVSSCITCSLVLKFVLI
jgi:hypothetical protein